MSKVYSGGNMPEAATSNDGEYEQLATSLSEANIRLSTVLVQDEVIHVLTEEERNCIRAVQTASRRFETLINRQWSKVAKKREKVQ